MTMNTATTLTAALQQQRTDDRGITYIESQDNEITVSYDALYERALGLLHYLQEKGLQPGDELILLLNNNQAFIELFWACLLGKIIPVPLAVGTGDQHRLKVFNVFQTLQRPHLLTTEKNLTRLQTFAQNNALTTQSEKLTEQTLLLEHIDDLSQAGQIHAPAPSDTAFIQFSSGSTGSPKGVVLTHHNIITNLQAIVQGSNSSQQDVSLSWMPLTHDMGIIGFHLAPLFLGATQYLMPTDVFIRRPLLWLTKASEKKVTTLASPNFGYKHYLNQFEKQTDHHLDLSHVRLIFNGAEPISPTICEEFITKLQAFGLADNVMFPVYGLAEASLAVSFPAPGKALSIHYVDREQLKPGEAARLLEDDAPHALSLISVGNAVADCAIQISDPNGNALPEGQVGHVLIRGNNVTNAYYNNDTLNQALFTDDGWLDTGDLGFVHQGQLLITGRAKEVMIINGQNLYPHDIEASLAQHTEAELGKVAAYRQTDIASRADELLIFVLYKGAAEQFVPMLKNIRKHLNEAIGIDAKQIIPIKDLPKTTSGKIQRYLLVENFQTGQYSDVLNTLEPLLTTTTPTPHGRSDIEQTLLTICNDYIEQTLTATDNIFDMGTSSLKLAQIYEKINALYPDQIDVTEIFDYPTVAELARYLETKLSAGTDKAATVSASAVDTP